MKQESTKEHVIEETSLEANSVPDYHDPDYFPDGGTWAWLALFGGFLVVLATWGITTSFGVFTAYYKKELLPNASSFQIGWINSVQTAFIFYGGSLSGKLFDMGYFYHLEIAGSTIAFVSFLLVAECTEYYQVFLAQGVGLGLGMGFLFGPALACTGAYFKKRRPFAMAMCTTGGGFGGVIFPIIANNLLYSSIGFKWAMRILAFCELFLFIMIIAVMRDRIPRHVRQARLAKSAVSTSLFSLSSWIDKSALHDPVFMLFAVGIACCFFVTYPPYAFLQSFAIHISAPANLTKYIISLLGAFSFLGRFSTYFLARWVGALTCTGIVALLSSITLFCWAEVHNTGGLIAFTVVYGFLSGAIGAFPPFIVPQLTPDITRLGVRLGMVFLGLGTAVILSIPMAGLTLGATFDNFRHASILCGSAMMAGAVFLSCARIARAGFQLSRI